jgi:hypothetical protein
MMVVAAEATLPVPEHEVFELLADLDRHRLLTDRGMRILRLDGPPGRRSGGLVELRGPFGVRRHARTRVRGAEFPTRLWGTAETPDGSRALLDWHLRPQPVGTRVRIELQIDPSERDRLLLACGGRVWLARRLRAGLRRLERSAHTRGA